MSHLKTQNTLTVNQFNLKHFGHLRCGQSILRFPHPCWTLSHTIHQYTTKREDSGPSRETIFTVATSCVDTQPHEGRSVQTSRNLKRQIQKSRVRQLMIDRCKNHERIFFYPKHPFYSENGSLLVTRENKIATDIQPVDLPFPSASTGHLCSNHPV